MIYRQFYSVKGTGNFPFDMLRYDCSFPELESQSPMLECNPLTHPDTYFTVPRTVKLCRYTFNKQAMPATMRWRSFGWEVLEETIQTERTK